MKRQPFAAYAPALGLTAAALGTFALSYVLAGSEADQKFSDALCRPERGICAVSRVVLSANVIVWFAFAAALLSGIKADRRAVVGLFALAAAGCVAMVGTIYVTVHHDLNLHTLAASVGVALMLAFVLGYCLVRVATSGRFAAKRSKAAVGTALALPAVAAGIGYAYSMTGDRRGAARAWGNKAGSILLLGVLPLLPLVVDRLAN